MKTLIFLICSVLVVTNCENASVIVIGSKFIRPKQPYTVAFGNHLNTSVKLKLHLDCGEESGFQRNATVQLYRHSIKSYSFDVPVIASSQCFFSAVNDGGTTEVNYEIDLHFPTKTLSIFILTDKPIYKPGDVIRFRVVVVDIALKPAKHIKSVEINMEDTLEQSRRQWTHAKLHNGIFESSYQLASVPVLGMWTITVKATGSSVENVKTQQFEVREFISPKFFVFVVPHRTLLSDQEVSLVVASQFAYGMPVQGKIIVELYYFSNYLKSTLTAENILNGSEKFTFQLQSELLPPEGQDHVMVTATVSVTEKFSNFTVTVTKNIPVYKYPYSISLIKSSANYRPGAAYFCKLSVKDHDGFPVEPQGRSILLKTDTGEDDLQGELNNQGIASFVLSMPDKEKNVTVSAEFEGEKYENIDVIMGLDTEPSQYLQVYTKNRIIAGRSVSFTFTSNELFTQLSYFIVSRGRILSVSHLRTRKRTSAQIKVKLTPEMAPYARLVVYTINNGQFIMDFFELDFEYFDHEFVYMLDEDQYLPAQDFYVDITAEKDSYVAFQAIDQGALLEHEEFGLTKKQVLHELEKYAEEVGHVFNPLQSFGLFLRFGNKTSYGSYRARRSVQLTRRRTFVKPIFLRNDFPEAWLWKSFTMNNKPTHSLSELVPATITSWYVTGFALSPSKGLGLMSAPSKFTVSKPFYMIANLPYSIKRGEVARIEIKLFNFLGNSLTTDVSLSLFNKNNEIDFVDGSSLNFKNVSRKAIVVPTNQAESISFMMRAKKLGKIVIKIEAFNELASDGLEHILRVVPESRQLKTSESRLINLPTYGKQSYNINCSTSQEVDPESTEIYAIINPPFIASIANSLDTLLVPPTGGADFNLMTIIPNVVLLDYLKETEMAAADIETKAKDYLSSSYQNQLKYKDSNGAFSQWKPPKGKPSVFLTALVANAITTASKHITVSEKVISDAFTWISGKQKSNGCFKEEGEIIYAPMQDSSSSFALTAFVVAAIKENENIASQFGAVAEKGIKCLANNFNSLTKTHDIAVATYALSLAKHANQKYYLDRLVRDSYNDDKGRYWSEELDVEISGYALLAYIAQNNYLDAIPIMKWLIMQRYSTLEFAGIQSTFVALKALGRMAIGLNTVTNDYKVHIKNGQNILSYVVEGLNALEPIRLALPDNERLFSFEFEGIGFGYFQLRCQYQQNIQNSDHNRFDLNVKVLDTSSYDVQHLQVCLMYNAPEGNTVTGTTLVEVHLPSGMEFNDNAVNDSSGQIKNTERAYGKTAMFVYYSTLGDKQEVCFEVTAHRKFKIAMHRPSYVVVYDTNNREHYAIKQYEGKVLQMCDICDADDCDSMNC